MKITQNVEKLKKNEVFVFGSNLNGKKLQKRLLTLNPDSEYATDYQDIIINVKLLIEKLKGYFEIKDLL